jgi:hypothetical protein
LVRESFGDASQRSVKGLIGGSLGHAERLCNPVEGPSTLLDPRHAPLPT